jgi:hypothetical protein
MATISLDLALLGDLRAVATGCPEDALSVAAPANPPTRHTERLSPQQMWVCGPSRARQVIRHKALLPPEFGFRPASWVAAAWELVRFWCVKAGRLAAMKHRRRLRGLVPDPELIRQRTTATGARHGPAESSGGVDKSLSPH